MRVEGAREELRPLVVAHPPLKIGQLYQYIPSPNLPKLLIRRGSVTGNSNSRVIQRKSIMIVLGAERNSFRVASSGFEGWIQLSYDLLSDKSIFKPLDSYYAYEDWSGNNYFFLNGRLMLGSHAVFFMASVIITVTASVLSFYYDAVETGGSPLMLCVAPTLLGCTMVNWFATALIEPGIIPHNSMQKQPFLPAGVPTNAGNPYSWKYCSTCNIYRPPRSKHCRFCQNCVMEFDHHCPYTGNCIGKRNRQVFLRFLFSYFLYAIVLFSSALSIVVDIVYASHERRMLHQHDFMLAHDTEPVTRLMLGIFLTLIWTTAVVILAPFCWYHIKITSLGQTTNEYQNKVYASIENPFDLGIALNWLSVCCKRIPPSNLQDMHRVCTAQDCLQSNCMNIQLEALLCAQGSTPASYNSTMNAATPSGAGNE